MKFSAVLYRDIYRIVASVSWYVSYRDFAGDTQPYAINDAYHGFKHGTLRNAMVLCKKQTNKKNSVLSWYLHVSSNKIKQTC